MRVKHAAARVSIFQNSTADNAGTTKDYQLWFGLLDKAHAMLIVVYGDCHNRDTVLERLICPVTRTPLTYDRARQELVSRRAQLAYPIRDGLPIMLESEARPLDDEAP